MILAALDLERILQMCKVRRKLVEVAVQVFLLLMSAALLIFPLLHTSHQQEQVVLLLANHTNPNHNSRRVSIVFLRRVNSPEWGDFPGEWREVRRGSSLVLV